MPTFQLKGKNRPSRECEKKMQKILSKTKGIVSQNIDLEKGLVHVESNVDIKNLREKFKKKFKEAHVVEKDEGGPSSRSSQPDPAPEYGDHGYGPDPGYGCDWQNDLFSDHYNHRNYAPQTFSDEKS
ncbi:hypothetical protein GH714_033567 [Hevea brasiliensis]|uniref:HMA domain-containing protein n=1 Tax=Hevea brasiliensis TaxID=3981 RepID=A0A6A6L2P4_HEVBR|nr:hypothetical protein GH714_033567 [Hevea brasiliensis]